MSGALERTGSLTSFEVLQNFNNSYTGSKHPSTRTMFARPTIWSRAHEGDTKGLLAMLEQRKLFAVSHTQGGRERGVC